MSDHSVADHRHGHHFLPHGHARNERRTRIVVALTLVMMIGEIVAGWLTGSMALLADGFHMATHAAALGIAAAAYAYARRHADNPRFTFGTGKVGDLAGFTSAIILGLVAAGIAFESAERLMNPGRVAFAEATVVAVLGLVVNLVSAWLLGDDGHDHDHGHHHHDNNMRSAYLHVLADALTSILAIAALIGGRLLGWQWLDPAVGIVGAVVIAIWAWGLLRTTARILVDTAETDRLAEITRAIEAPGDATVTDLHVWQIGPGAHAAIVALVTRNPLEPAAYRARLAAMKGLSHVTVEVGACAAPH